MAPAVLAEGKTKRVVEGPRPGTVLLVARDRLTAGDAARAAGSAGIGVHKTAQAEAAMRRVAAAGVPTALLGRAAPDALLCRAARMVPIELVARRFAWGSLLKRDPSARRADGRPLRFDEPRLEVFHKRTLVVPPAALAPAMLDESEARTRYLRGGRWAEGCIADPLVLPAAGGRWGLHDPGAPPRPGEPLHEVDPELTDGELHSALEGIALPAFLALEEAWASVATADGPIALADAKFEVGRGEDGSLMLADVVDNDSWRIWPGGDPALALDKQRFRDGDPLSEVADDYELVAALAARFAPPRGRPGGAAPAGR